MSFNLTRAEESTLRPPLPVWPSDYARIAERHPAFRLNGRAGATAYRVEVAKDAAFTEPVNLRQFKITEPGGIEPVVIVPHEGTPLADGTWYWRAFCRDAAGRETPAANYRAFDVVPKADEISVPPGLSHPRLILSASELPAFRARLSRSAHLQRGWQYMLNAAQSIALEKEPTEEYARSGGGQHGNYNAAADWYHRHLDNLAFVAWVSNDKRLARRGVEMLMTACRFSRWLGPWFDDPKHFDPPWHAALETAMMTEAVAIAYDLLYDDLSDAQRQIVRISLMEKGVRPLVKEWADPVGASRIPRHQLASGNWVMVCSSGGGVGALALLGDHPEAPEMVRLVRDRIRAWMLDRGGDYCADGIGPQWPKPIVGPSEPNFGPRGGFKETITYMNYAMRYVCYFADPLRHITGDDLFRDFPPNLLDPVTWSVLGWQEEGKTRSSAIDFGDCGAFADFYDLYTALMRNTRDGRAAWLYNRTVAVPQTLRPLAWYDDTITENPPRPTLPLAQFDDIGQVVMRTGWSPRDAVAAIKFKQNRGHLDLGTVYLFGGGAPAIIDSGSINYASPIYRDYSSQTIGHNVVLVDGKPQRRTDGEMLASLATPDIAAASGQLAAAYPDALLSWSRDLVMLPGGDVIVHDHLAGRGEHQFDYLLHPGPPFEIQADGGLSLENGTRIRVDSETALAPTLQDGYYLTLPRKYVRFTSQAPRRQQSFAMLCRWPGKPLQTDQGALASVSKPSRHEPGTLIPNPDGYWTLHRDDGASEVTAQIGESRRPDRMNDARVWVVSRKYSRPGELQALALGGSRLFVDGKYVFMSSRPVDLAIEAGRPTRITVQSAQGDRLLIPRDPMLTHVFVDGQQVEAEGGIDQWSIPIPAGQHEIEISDVRRTVPRLGPLVASDLPAVTVPEKAPAFIPGMRATSSSTGEEAMAVLDGDPNTAWTSLPGVSAPHQIEIDLPRAERIGWVRLDPGQACRGSVEVFDVADGRTHRATFTVESDRSDAFLVMKPMMARRIRVVISEVGGRATLKTLEWGEHPPAAPAEAAKPDSADAAPAAPTRVEVSRPIVPSPATTAGRAAVPPSTTAKDSFAASQPASSKPGSVSVIMPLTTQQTAALRLMIGSRPASRPAAR